MCGIAGIWNAEQAAPEALARVGSMLGAMRHRGPDGSGTLAWPGGAAGMVRLALVDLSERGQQPLWSADGKVAIVFNGEMYNHQEHRVRLRAGGYRFKSETDTEVVLALYLERGLDFVEAIRGMFALAIFDFRERGLEQPPKLVLARDPFGIKPLYLRRDSLGLVFASELRALLQSRRVEPRIDREGLADFLTFGFVLQPRTMLEGVTMLGCGTLRVEEPGKPTREHRFWLMPPAADSGDDFVTSAAKLRATLEESVRMHALADTPVGAFLSGGVDSSAMVALMSQHNAKLRTYTVRMKDPAYDESRPAREFAARLGCVHTEVEVGDSEVRELFPRFAASLDQPSTDGFNTWLVSRAAARDVKGVVSGLGGDEWFAGYPVIRRMNALSPKARLFGRLARRAAPHVPGRLSALATRAATRASPMATWAAAHQLFTRAQVERLTQTSVGDGAERLQAALGDRLTDREPADLGCQLDVWGYMCCQLLRDSDATAMASSLELRVPLVDREVAAVARGIRPEHRLSERGMLPSKRVLVEAVREVLPPDMDQRPKRGFALPHGEWIEGPLKPLFGDSLAALSKRGILAGATEGLSVAQRWGLVVLELWCQALVDHPLIKQEAA
jgi:asparagine synthase (glutamine-hydrolysing)